MAASIADAIRGAVSTSALGQKQTSEHVRVMSALPPKADMDWRGRDLRFVPKADAVIELQGGPPEFPNFRQNTALAPHLFKAF